jgi:hypothetical protein
MAPKISYDAFDSVHKALAVSCIEEEYEWVASHAAVHFAMRDAFPYRQKLTLQGNRAYDTLYLELPDGSTREYWFDITSFYGKD